MAEYAHPEVLVSTQWVADHLSDPKIRLVEVDVDTTATIRATSRERWDGIGRRSCRTMFAAI